jgi:Ca2+-binding RTX toxin-like protein
MSSGTVNGTGNNLDNQIVGTDADNALSGLGANDILYGFGGADTLRGGDGADVLEGGAGRDRLEGGAQNDTINGGLSPDTMTGGAGFDTFTFDTTLGTSNVDSIVDFIVADDTIFLDHTVFTGLPMFEIDWDGQPRNLDSYEFRIGTAAQDANDHIIYDPNTGSLLYDSDGTGVEAAVQFATLNQFLNLSSADFEVF